MKIKYLLSSVVAATMLFTGCVDVDDVFRQDTAGMAELDVKGVLVNSGTAEYESVVDESAGTITVQVPYYISDTEEIQGDITQMKLTATLPVGCTFSPSIAGIHDLSQGFVTTYTDENGKKTKFTILAEYVKSSACYLTKVTLTEFERATIGITNPTTAGEHGKLTIYKTSSSIDVALRSAVAEVSPWATLNCSTLDATTGVMDLSSVSSIEVVAQNGVDKTVYDIVIDYPKFVDEGKVGYITALWGYQLYTDNEEGFVGTDNRSMAVVGDYLIVSNKTDLNKMLVLDRFTGKNTGKKVNVTGMPTNCEFRAICNDDADHLIAASYVSTVSGQETESSDVRIFVWENGIENAPTSKLYANINGSYFASAPIGVNTKNTDMFQLMSCKGDVTKTAVLTTCAKYCYRGVFIQITDGVWASKAYVEWGGGTVSMWNSTKFLPLTQSAPYGYIWCTGNFRKSVIYTPVGTSSSRGIDFNKPTSHWWSGSGTYDATARAIGYVEFNGLNLLAVDNEWTNNGGYFHRLYVSDISASPSASSLADGFIFDSREGNTAGTAGITGTGYSVTGMTSSYSFVTGKTVLDSSDGDEVSDVIFGKSSDGNSVQVYLLVPGQGAFCYEITRFDM